MLKRVQTQVGELFRFGIRMNGYNAALFAKFVRSHHVVP
jgi:hypothetical protein